MKKALALLLLLHATNAAATEAIVVPLHRPFRQGRAVISLGDRFGYIDRNGRIVIAPRYERATDFSDDGTAVVNGETLIDRDGRIVIHPRFRNASPFHEGLAAVEIAERQWGYIDQSGTLVIPARFRQAGEFREGRALVSLDDGYGYIDRRGQWITRQKFLEAQSFANGFAGVLDDWRVGWGFVDRTGRVAIPMQFERVRDFAEGYGARAPRRQVGVHRPPRPVGDRAAFRRG